MTKNNFKAQSYAVESPGQDSLSRGLKASFFGHLAIFLLIVFKSIFYPNKPYSYIPTLKVDLVGLPEVLKKDLKNPSLTQLNQEISKILKQADESAKRAKAQAPISNAEPKHEMGLQPKSDEKKKIEKRNKRALDRFKSLAKLDQAQEVIEEKQVQQPVKGNKISQGSTLTGEARESLRMDYLDLLHGKLQENWVLPPWLSRQNLAAQIQITLNASGEILAFHFVKPSGNPQFDEAVKNTLHNSEPFPSPPKELASSLLTDGILIGFPL